MRCPVCGGTAFTPRVDDLVDLEDLDFKVHSVFGVELVRCLDCDFLTAAHVHPETLTRYYAVIDPAAIPAEDLHGHRLYDLATRRAECQAQMDAFAHLAGSELGGRRLLWSAGRADVAASFADGAAELSVVDMLPTAALEGADAVSVTRLDEDALDDDARTAQFDAMIMSNVLERLVRPRYQLRRAARLLRPGGHLFIEVPDEMMLAETYGYYGIHHINFFSPKSIRRAIETEGSFEIIHQQSCNQSLDDLLRSGVFKHLHDATQTADGRVIRLVLRNRGLGQDPATLNDDAAAEHLYALGMQCMLLNIHLQNLEG